jgi:hypothetical protein
MGVGGQRHAPAALPTGMTRYPLYRRLGKAPGPVWKGIENLARTGIRSPDRPARSESLYRLRYPGPHIPFLRVLFNDAVNCCASVIDECLCMKHISTVTDKGEKNLSL